MSTLWWRFYLLLERFSWFPLRRHCHSLAFPVVEGKKKKKKRKREKRKRRENTSLISYPDSLEPITQDGAASTPHRRRERFYLKTPIENSEQTGWRTITFRQSPNWNVPIESAHSSIIRRIAGGSMISARHLFLFNRTSKPDGITPQPLIWRFNAIFTFCRGISKLLCFISSREQLLDWRDLFDKW